MNKKIFILLAISLVGTQAWAGSVTVPNTFVDGTTASASEVNTNFNELTSAVNDNHNRLIDIETEPNLSDFFIGTWSAKSYNNGFEGNEGSITFHSNGAFSLNSGTLSILVGCNTQDCPSSGGTWEALDHNLLKMTLDGLNPINNEPYGSSYPFIVNITADKVSLARSFNFTLLVKQ